jgi:cell wall-associated NlpC family hydrolase
MQNKPAYTMTAQLRLLLSITTIVSLSACSALKSSSKSGNTSSNSASMKMRQEITDYARKFVGTTYKYAGQSPSTGFDCSGFTSYVLKGFGVSLSPASAVQSTTGRRVSLDQVQAGDLLFFGESEKKIQHVALVVKRDKSGITCVHSTTSRGVMVENVSVSTYWKPKILFGRDVLGR